MTKQFLIAALTLTIIGLTLNLSLIAQSKSELFKSETPATWMGIDFSEARYLGDPGTVSTYEMKQLFSKINFITVSESDKRHGQAIAAASLPEVTQ